MKQGSAALTQLYSEYSKSLCNGCLDTALLFASHKSFDYVAAEAHDQTICIQLTRELVRCDESDKTRVDNYLACLRFVMSRRHRFAYLYLFECISYVLDHKRYRILNFFIPFVHCLSMRLRDTLLDKAMYLHYKPATHMLLDCGIVANDTMLYGNVKLSRYAERAQKHYRQFRLAIGAILYVSSSQSRTMPRDMRRMIARIVWHNRVEFMAKLKKNSRDRSAVPK